MTVTSPALPPSMPNVGRLLAAQIGYQARLLASGRAITIGVGLPVILLIGSHATDTRTTSADVAGYAVFGLTLTAWNTYGVRLVAAREAGVLKRWRATPLPRWCYFLGRILATVVVAAVAGAATVAAAVLLYNTPLTVSAALGALVVFVLGAFAWGAIATALTAAIPTVEAAAPTFMLTYFPIVIISGLLGSTSEPHWLSTIATYLPAQPLAHAVAAALAHTAGHAWLPARDLIVLASWAIAGIGVAVVTFRWEPHRPIQRRGARSSRRVSRTGPGKAGDVGDVSTASTALHGTHGTHGTHGAITARVGDAEPCLTDVEGLCARFLVGPVKRKQDLEPLGWPLVRLALVLVLGGLAPMLDTTIASVALHTLAGQFDVGVSSVQWVTTGYLLALAVTIPVSGWATDRFGDKPLWISSLALFTVGSALSGLAGSFASLVAFRALQGCAAGLITPLVQTMLVRAAGREKLGRVITIVTIVTLFPPIVGPVVAGVILANASWRWIFYVNVPICLAAIVLAWAIVTRPAARSQNQAPRRLDLTGVLLLSPALVAVLYGLSQAATAKGFASFDAFVPLATGIVLAAGYLVHSLKRPGRSLVDLRLFAIRSFASAAGVLFFSGLSLYAAMFLLPLYYQEVRGQDALAAGLLLAPQGLGALLSRPVGGIVDKIGARRIVLAGVCLCALGTVPYIFAGPHTSQVLLGCALVVRGAGLSGANIAIVTGAFRDVPRPSVPDAAIITRTLQQVGGSFGTAVLAVILVTGANNTASSFHLAFGWAVGLTALALVPALLIPTAQKQ